MGARASHEGARREGEAEPRAGRAEAPGGCSAEAFEGGGRRGARDPAREGRVRIASGEAAARRRLLPPLPGRTGAYRAVPGVAPAGPGRARARAPADPHDHGMAKPRQARETTEGSRY